MLRGLQNCNPLFHRDARKRSFLREETGGRETVESRHATAKETVVVLRVDVAIRHIANEHYDFYMLIIRRGEPFAG